MTSYFCYSCSLLEVSRHVRVPRTMIHNEPTDELAVCRQLVAHMHDLHLEKTKNKVNDKKQQPKMT